MTTDNQEPALQANMEAMPRPDAVIALDEGPAAEPTGVGAPPKTGHPVHDGVIPRHKLLDIWGSAIVLLSALIQLFILTAWDKIADSGYTMTIMENQTYLASTIHTAYLSVIGVGTPAEISERMSQAQIGLKLYDEVYDWATELWWARAITGISFAVGSVMIISAKVIEPQPLVQNTN